MQRFFAPEILQIYVRYNKMKEEIKCRAPWLLFTIFNPLFTNKNYTPHHISNYIVIFKIIDNYLLEFCKSSQEVFISI